MGSGRHAAGVGGEVRGAAGALRGLHPVALHALETLLAGEERLCIAIQNVAEFWNSATRPVAHNGLGFSIERAEKEIERLEYFFEILK